MNEVVWQDPPEHSNSRAGRIMAILRTKPGVWALIYTGPVRFIPWWTQIHNDANYEVKVMALNREELFGSREVYARYIGAKG